jgi:hypothetical protein
MTYLRLEYEQDTVSPVFTLTFTRETYYEYASKYALAYGNGL